MVNIRFFRCKGSNYFAYWWSCIGKGCSLGSRLVFGETNLCSLCHYRFQNHPHMVTHHSIRLEKRVGHCLNYTRLPYRMAFFCETMNSIPLLSVFTLKLCLYWVGSVWAMELIQTLCHPLLANTWTFRFWKQLHGQLTRVFVFVVVDKLDDIKN